MTEKEVKSMIEESFARFLEALWDRYKFTSSSTPAMMDDVLNQVARALENARIAG